MFSKVELFTSNADLESYIKIKPDPEWVADCTKLQPYTPTPTPQNIDLRK